jgi:predicted dehydrogenase
MLEAAARRGLVVATAYNGRFRNNGIRARELMAANAIGRVHTMHLSVIEDLYTAFNTGGFGGSKPWFFEPVNVGYVIDGLPHAIDLMRWITGAEVRSAAGFSRTFTPDWRIEDTTVGIYEFSNGAVCSVTSSGAAVGPYPGAFAQYRLLGTEGLMNIDMYGDLHVSDRKEGWRLVATQPKVGFDDASTAFQDVRMQCYVDQIKSFIDGIHGRPMVAGSGFDGRAGVAACLALLDSSKAGRIVRLS